MESILSKEHKSDKREEDLNSRCNVFVQVSVERLKAATYSGVLYTFHEPRRLSARV